jgi:hypothetical protein
VLPLIDEDFWGEDDKVTVQENVMLEASFSEEEIKMAIFESYAKGALGLDSFSFMI